MRKILNIFMVLGAIVSMLLIVGCKSQKDSFAETLTLDKAVLNEVEFENSEKTKIKSIEDGFEILGEVEAMTQAQASTFGVDDVTHVVVVKFEFDKERTIDSFTIRGDVTKVYSTNKNDENYVGSLSSLLDNKDGEDAYCNLILSANTKEYTLISKYSDDTTSEIKLKINATLVTAVAE